MQDENAFIILKAIQRLDGRLDGLESAKRLPKALSMNQVAEQLGFSYDTVRKLMDRGDLRYIQSGPNASKRILLSDLEDWLKKNASRTA